MAESSGTTKRTTVSVFKVGGAHNSLPGFKNAAGRLPDSSQLWTDYYNNVLRGDEDKYSSPSEFVDANRTFNDAESGGLRTPDFDKEGIDGNKYLGEAGEPLGAFMPTLGSPGEGNGTNYSAIEAMPDFVISDFYEKGHGYGTNGTVLSPRETSSYQTSNGNASAPNYTLGSWSPTD